MRAIGVDRWWMDIGDGRGWALPEATQLKVKSETPSTMLPRFWRESPMYPEKETYRFLQWTSKPRRSGNGDQDVRPMRGTRLAGSGTQMREVWRDWQGYEVIDFSKMELGRVTRTYKGKPVERITRCAKCGDRGARSVFIPEKRSGARPYVSWHHAGHTVNAVAGFAYFSVDKSCTAKLSVENSDDLLNIAERKEYDAWRADMHAFVDGTEPAKPRTTQKGGQE